VVDAPLGELRTAGRDSTFVSGDLSLFGDDESNEPVQPARSQASIPDWLVDSLRKALDARGLQVMDERQKAIEAVAERPVESLRSLTRAEAMRVLERLGAPAPQSRSTAWDEREEDTWIDRL
jgi:DNA polymerase-3 subunit epsilon